MNIEALLTLLNTTNLVFKLGSKLFDIFPNIEELFSIPTKDLINLGISEQEADKLKNPDWSISKQDLNWASKDNNHIIAIDDPLYPELLKQTPNPPLLLFVSGDINLLQNLQIAIVGSRNPTYVGCDTAASFAKELVNIGLVITSGFASGIDACAHRGAISACGKTIAVMGTGIQEYYPNYHAKLAQDIIRSGGILVSEFPRFAKANKWHFPLRNRIISGLSVGTLVVEATIRSGSLITARLSAEYGRDVFAVPGSIINPLSRGSHYLIRQGAKLVENYQDIVDELSTSSYFSQINLNNTKTNCAKKNQLQNKLDRKYNKLLECVGFENTTIDQIVARIDLSVSEISAMLLELELNGLIKAVCGGYIKRC